MTLPHLTRLIKPAILVLAILSLLANSLFLTAYVRRMILTYEKWFEPGYQFITFRAYLKNVEEMGYITDEPLSRENNDGSYLQAQYFFAPTLIKEGYHGDEFNILDSENIPFILEQFRTLNAKRLTNTFYGHALTRRRL